MPLRALALLAGLGLIWGLTGTVTKIALEAGVPPLAYGFWQCVLAGTVLFAICAVRGSLPPFDRPHLRYYVVCGAVGLVGPSTVMYLALRHIPAGLYAMIITSTPILTYLAALAVRQERFDGWRGGGLALGFVGALLILLPRGSLPEPAMAVWVALAFLTPLGYALNAVFAAGTMPRETDALALAAGMVVFGVAGFGVASAATGSFYVPWPPGAPGAWAVWWHGIASAIAYVLYFSIIRAAGAVYLSQVGYIVVAIGVASGMAILDERHSVWVWAAFAVMLLGLTLVDLGQRRIAARRARRAAPSTRVSPRRR